MTRPFLMTLMVAMAGVFLASSLARADDTPAANPGAPSTQPDQAAPLRFYGPITAIDTNAKTFTVGDQTFQIADETKMTKGDGSAATLSDAVVGEPARGSYTKTADGKLMVTKVRFGKKTGGKSGGKSGGKKKGTTQPSPTASE